MMEKFVQQEQEMARLALKPGTTIVSSLAAAAVVFAVSVILHPGDGFAATRLLAVLFFAPMVARPMTDAAAWVIGARAARPDVQPVLCEMSIQLVGFLLAAALILLVTYIWVGPLRIIAGIAFSLAAAPLLAKPMLHVLARRLERFGERQSTKAFVFGQRNRLYHEGGERDPFISALAQVHFGLACDLFVRLDTGFQIWLQEDEMSEIGRRYAAGHLGGLLSLPRIAESLLDGLPLAPVRSLPQQAADAAETARLELAESFRFLLDDNPNRYGSAKLLDLAQRNASREALLQKRGLDGAGQRSPRFQEALAAINHVARVAASTPTEHFHHSCGLWVVRAKGSETR